MRELRRYEFLLEAATPIAHHSDVSGNEATVFRRKIRYGEGFANVPIVTADTMRHGMREAAAYALLEAAGLLGEARLSEAALRLLFAGGMMSGRGESGAIKLDAYRALCDLVPSMALFGGCAENRIIPGTLTVEDATLVCVESAAHVPAWTLAAMRERYGSDILHTSRAHVEEEQRVRMDPLLVPEKRLMLSEGARAATETKLLASEAAHESDDAIAREDAKSSMMPRRFERVVQGSLFAWAVEAVCNTELDLDTLHVAVGCFLAHAVVGGKKGTGHGKLRPVDARKVSVGKAGEPVQVDVKLPPETVEIVDPARLSDRPGDLFRRHVHERREKVREFLGRVDA